MRKLIFVIVCMVIKMKLAREEAIAMLTKWMGNKYFFEYAHQKSEEFRIYFGSLNDFERHRIRKCHKGESTQHSNIIQIQEVVDSPLFEEVFKKLNSK